MATQNLAAAQNSATKSDEKKVKVRVKYQTLVHREFHTRGDGQRESNDTWAQPGEVIEVSEKDAERMIKRSFDGYPTTEEGRGGPTPGVVRDALADAVAA